MHYKIAISLGLVLLLTACTATEPQTAETFLPVELEPSVEVEREDVEEEEGTLSQQEQAFEALYYYESENLSRYTAYQQETGYSADEVVWRVNMNLDRTVYEDTEQIEDTDTLTLIVNKRFQLPDNYVPENLVSLPSGRYVDKDAKTAYDLMVAAAYWDGYYLWECSAYRSISTQTWLYNNYLQTDSQEEVDSYSSRPGYSEHHTGRAIDLMTNGITRLSQFVGTPEADWVAENAYRFGFIVRYNENNTDVTGYTPEPWHIYYVGTAHALMIRELGLDSLEEYVAKYVEYSPEGFQLPEAPALPDVPSIPAVTVTPEVPDISEDLDVPAEDLAGDGETPEQEESEQLEDPESSEEEGLVEGEPDVEDDSAVEESTPEEETLQPELDDETDTEEDIQVEETTSPEDSTQIAENMD